MIDYYYRGGRIIRPSRRRIGGVPLTYPIYNLKVIGREGYYLARLSSNEVLNVSKAY